MPENDDKHKWSLDPSTTMYFVWPELIEQERVLSWFVDLPNNDDPHNVRIDSSGKDEVKYHVEASYTAHDDSIDDNSKLMFLFYFFYILINIYCFYQLMTNNKHFKTIHISHYSNLNIIKLVIV